MPGGFLTHLMGLLAQYGFPVLLPLAVIEGPATSIIAGALVATGQLNGVTVCLMLVLADLVGDVGYYALGRYGHGPLSARVGRWLRLSPEKITPWEHRFNAHDWKLLLIGKTQGFGSVILYLAGATRMSFARYMVLNLIGTFPKVVLFETIGYFLGQTILHSVKYVDYVTALSFAVALVLLGVFFFIRRLFWKSLVHDQPE